MIDNLNLTSFSPPPARSSETGVSQVPGDQARHNQSLEIEWGSGLSDSSEMRAKPGCLSTCGRVAMGLTAIVGLGAGAFAGTYYIAQRIQDKGAMPDPLPFGPRPVSFQDCTAADEALVLASDQRVANYINETLAHPILFPEMDASGSPVSVLTPQNEADLYACFAPENQSCVTYVCDYDPISCPSHEDGSTLGYFSGPAFGDNKIYLCMDNMRSLYDAGVELDCKLDELIVHEAAHYVDVDKKPDHNSGPNGDAVYRSGDAADNVCRSHHSV